MSQLFEKCKKCVDSVYIDWEKTTLPKEERKTIEDYMAWGIVHLALYILEFDEYNAFKQYIYDTKGYNPGGVETGQIDIFDLKGEEDEC